MRSHSSRPTLGVDFHVWDGIFQGSRSHLLGIYTEAIRQAPEIDFIFFLDGVESLREAHEEFRRPNVRLVHMPHRSAPVRLLAQLPWLQWRHGIDLLHMQYRLPFIRVGPCACTVHDLLFETHPQFFPKGFVRQSRITYRIAVRNAALLFAVSQFSKGELTRLYGVDADRIAVTYNGVDRSRFYPGPGGEDVVAALGLEPGNYLLTVGRLEPRKNHTTLVKAYAGLGPSAPRLVIVGQRDFHFDGVLQTIRDLGLSDRVLLLENVRDEVLPAVMRHAMVFVYPAFAEGFGMPVAEAMASGVPVITSNTTSLPEVAGDAAQLVDPTSVTQLQAAMERLLQDPSLRARSVAAGLAQMQLFDWKQSAGVLLEQVRKYFSTTGS